MDFSKRPTTSENKELGSLAGYRSLNRTEPQPKAGLMNFKQVQEYLSMTKTQINYMREDDTNEFPPPIKLSNRLYWTQQSIDAWLLKKAQEQHVELLGITKPGNR